METSKTLKKKDADVVNRGERVYVNVYHLHWPNGMKMGAFHTGTEVFSKEYGYGGHPYNSSGIFQIDPRCVDDMGLEFTFKEAIYVGSTYLSQESVERLLVSMIDEFKGDAYHLLHHNCNHFTAQFIRLLCGAELPGWVNWLAKAVGSIPFMENMLPANWIRPQLDNDTGSEHSLASLDEVEPSHSQGRRKSSSVSNVSMLLRGVSLEGPQHNGSVRQHVSSSMPGPRIIEPRR